MPISFGSIGDIISTVQIAVQLLTALNESRGSSREFQDLVKSLRSFHRILEQLVVIWPTRSECPQLEAIHDTILPIVHECRGEIKTFLDTIISSYGRSLGGDRSKHKLKDMGKMLQWHILEGGAVAKLQGKLDNSYDIISLAYMFTQGVVKEKDQALVSEKLDFIKNRQSEIEKELDQRLDGIENELTQQTEILRRLPEVIRQIYPALSPTAPIGLNIRATSDEMEQMIQGLYQLHLIQPSISSPIYPSREMSAILEDALGYALRIPLETIRSWTVVKQLLIDNFSDRPGGDIVKAGRYVLQDFVSGRDLNPTTPFHRIVRPGQKIVMAMVFYSPGEEDKANTCPRCATVAISSSNQDICCSNPRCDVTFRRIIDESENLLTVAGDNNETALSVWEAATDEDQVEDSNVENNVLNNLLKGKRTEDGPEVFKRVRLFTRWQDSVGSRGHKIAAFGGTAVWDYAKTISGIAELFADAVFDHLERRSKFGYKNYVFEGSDESYFYKICFLGQTVQQSYPALFFYSKNKRVRQRIVKLVRSIAWVHQNGMLVASCSAPQWKEHFLDWALENRWPEEVERWRRDL